MCPSLFIFRFIQGVADAAAWGASLSILIELFPNKVATLMSYTEMCIGVGYMIGPALGSFLYELGGFILPYEIVGSILLVSAFGIYFSIPNTKSKGEQTSAPSEESNINGSARRIALSDVVKNLSILMPHIDNAMCYAGFGMIEAMLEPHMVQTVDATQRQVGYGFLISGVSYMFLTLIVGYVSKLCFTLEIRYLRKLSTFIFSFVTVQSIRQSYQSLVILSISFVSSLSDQSLHSR